MRLPTQDSATGRAIKTAVQAVLGFCVGLIATVWAVPGVPHAVIAYVQQNFILLMVYFGMSAGFASLVWNFLRKEVVNY